MEIQNSYLERKGPARFPRAPPGQAPRSASARPPSRGWGRPDKGLRGGVQLSRPLPSGAGGPPPCLRRQPCGRPGGGRPAGAPRCLPAAYCAPPRRHVAPRRRKRPGRRHGGTAVRRREEPRRRLSLPGARRRSRGRRKGLPPTGGGPGGVPAAVAVAAPPFAGPPAPCRAAGTQLPPPCSRAAPRLGMPSDLHFGR